MWILCVEIVIDLPKKDASIPVCLCQVNVYHQYQDKLIFLACNYSYLNSRAYKIMQPPYFFKNQVHAL